MLVDEHPEGDEGHVEPVQEVLDGNIHVLLNMLLVVELKDTLRQKELPVKRKASHLCHLPNNVLVIFFHCLKSAAEVSQCSLVQFRRVKQKKLLKTAAK